MPNVLILNIGVDVPAFLNPGSDPGYSLRS